MAASQHCHKHTVQLCGLARGAAGRGDAAASGFFFSSFFPASRETGEENKNMDHHLCSRLYCSPGRCWLLLPELFCAAKDDIAAASEFNINVRVSPFERQLDLYSGFFFSYFVLVLFLTCEFSKSIKMDMDGR